METITQEGKRTVCQISLEAQLLYKRLVEMREGDEISYEELNGIIGRNVQTIAYGALRTARNMCQRDDRMVVVTVSGKGVRRLKNEEISGAAQNHISRIRKQCHMGFRKLTCVDIENLTNEKKIEYYAIESNLGALAVFSKSGAIKKLEDTVKLEKAALPVGKVFELFKG